METWSGNVLYKHAHTCSHICRPDVITFTYMNVINASAWKRMRVTIIVAYI